MANKPKKVLKDPLDQEMGFRVFRTGMADPLSATQMEYANGNRRPASEEEFYMYTLIHRIYEAAPDDEATSSEVEPEGPGPEESLLSNGHGEVVRTLKCNPEELS